jgi:hypothetical protein
MATKHYVAYLQTWTESERGWGQRPDGHSLHKSPEDAKAYIKRFEDDQKALNGPGVPDEYSFAEGRPTLVKITKAAADALEKKGDLRFWHTDYEKFVIKD